MAKTLILYFSVYDSTRRLAEEIARQTGGDLLEIEPVIPYDKNRDHYDALAAYAKKEHDEDQRPAIKNAIDLSDYDTVFIGYPMWWYTFPMIIYTLFDTVDFSGKTVVPFNTHMGSRDGGTYKTVREKARGATVLEGLPVSMKEAEGGAGKSVEKWLTKLGLKNKIRAQPPASGGRAFRTSPSCAAHSYAYASELLRRCYNPLRILHINIWRKTYEKDNFKHGKNCSAGNGSLTYFCRLFKR